TAVLGVAARTEQVLRGRACRRARGLQRRDPSAAVLVDGALDGRLGGLLDGPDPGADQEFGVAALTELLVVGVTGSAALAEHGVSRQSTVGSRQSRRVRRRSQYS